MHGIQSRPWRVVLSTIAALGLAALPLVPALGRAPLAYAANDIVVDDDTMQVSEASGAGAQDDFNVRLSNAPSGDVVLRVINPDSSEITLDKAELRFNQTNWNVDQKVTVTAVDDSDPEGTQTFTIRLESDNAQTLDSAYDNKSATVQATVSDNESGIMVNKTSMTVAEAGSDTFTVALTQAPSGIVTVRVEPTSGEATVNKTELVFNASNWNEPQTVTVTGADDSATDGTESATVTISVVDSQSSDDFDSAPDRQITLSVTDNESASGFSITETDNSTRITEGGTDTFSVALSRQPASDVVIAVTSSSSDVTVDKTQLRFTRDNWNQSQTVTASSTDNTTDEGDRSATITLSVMDDQSDNDFDALADRNIGVTVVDNDPAIQVRPAALFPVNGAKITGLGTELRWTQTAGARWFELRVTPHNNDGPGIHLIISDDEQVATASYTVQDPDFGSADPNYVMLPDMTYTWQVRTAQGTSQPAEGDWSAWSDPSSFETGNKSSNTITLMSPSNTGGVVSSMRPTLIWSNSDDDVFYYEVQVSRDASFCNSSGCPMLYWELRHGGVTSPTNSYTIPSGFPLEGSHTYFWRVRPRIQGDGTPVAWSQAASFRTP